MVRRKVWIDTPAKLRRPLCEVFPVPVVEIVLIAEGKVANTVPVNIK
jgi:hypothetical protein